MELIVVVAVLAVMLVGVGSTLSGTLRGARKVETAANSRSEGAYALGLLERKLKYAQSVVDCSTSGGDDVTIVGGDGVESVLHYGPTNKNLLIDATILHSDDVQVTRNSGCGGVFTCDADRTQVEICFDVDKRTTSPLKTETGKINFKTLVSIVQ